MYTAAATDVQGGAVTLQPDAARTRRAFSINAATGAVTFNASPDFETEVVLQLQRRRERRHADFDAGGHGVA